MPRLSLSQVTLLETLYQKILDDALVWTANSAEKNSYSTTLGEFKIDVDHRNNNRGPHVVWVFSNGSVVDHIYERDAQDNPTSLGEAGDFGELIKIMYETVKKRHVDEKLLGVIEALKRS